MWDVEGEVEGQVDAARRRLPALCGLKAEARPFADEAGGELARHGRAVDLLVLGGHRSEPMDELLGASVAERLADQAPRALLVLPRDARTRITRTA